MKAGRKSVVKGGKRGKKQEEEKVELTEEEKAEQKAEQRRNFIKNHCTNLKFILLDNTIREKLCEGERCERYPDLQRLIAKNTPRSLQIFIPQDYETGEITTSENFKEQHEYRVKEMRNYKLESTAKSRWRPQVDPRWEFYEYHGGPPPNWVDPIEEEKKRKIKAEKEKKDREKADAEAEKVMARMAGGESDDDDDGDPFDPM
jgi:hypothetical protein